METSVAIRQILLAQLALEDPAGHGDGPKVQAGQPARPLVELIDRLVDETFDMLGDANAKQSRLAVAAVIGRSAQTLGRAATALWKSTVLEEIAPDLSPLISAPEQGDVGQAYANYLASLKQLADVLGQTRLNPMDLPITEGAAQETESLAPVFAFLSERRFQLRRLIHAVANQQMIGSSCAEMGADRGDQIAALYHTTVLGVELPEEPENWTLRDKPEYLRQTLVSLISDLRQLADATEIGWKALLTDVRASYEEERDAQ